MANLDTNDAVRNWVIEYPQTARVFERFGIDYCCGGATTLAEACRTKDLDASTVMAELDRAMTAPTADDEAAWGEAPLTELSEHILRTHHVFLRTELPRLTILIDKVADVHAAQHPELNELRQVFAALREELESHMMKEERILFPAIQAMESAARRPQFAFGTLANPIRMMEHEHDVAGRALAQVRRLTRDFHAPADACPTYHAMLSGLQQLEFDLHTHIHKENNILFPRAQALENQLTAQQSSQPK